MDFVSDRILRPIQKKLFKNFAYYNYKTKRFELNVHKINKVIAGKEIKSASVKQELHSSREEHSCSNNVNYVSSRIVVVKGNIKVGNVIDFVKELSGKVVHIEQINLVLKYTLTTSKESVVENTSEVNCNNANTSSVKSVTRDVEHHHVNKMSKMECWKRDYIINGSEFNCESTRSNNNITDNLENELKEQFDENKEKHVNKTSGNKQTNLFNSLMSDQTNNRMQETDQNITRRSEEQCQKSRGANALFARPSSLLSLITMNDNCGEQKDELFCTYEESSEHEPQLAGVTESERVEQLKKRSIVEDDAFRSIEDVMRCIREQLTGTAVYIDNINVTCLIHWELNTNKSCGMTKIDIRVTNEFKNSKKENGKCKKMNKKGLNENTENKMHNKCTEETNEYSNQDEECLHDGVILHLRCVDGIRAGIDNTSSARSNFELSFQAGAFRVYLHSVTSLREMHRCHEWDNIVKKTEEGICPFDTEDLIVATNISTLSTCTTADTTVSSSISSSSPRVVVEKANNKNEHDNTINNCKIKCAGSSMKWETSPYKHCVFVKYIDSSPEEFGDVSLTATHNYHHDNINVLSPERTPQMYITVNSEQWAIMASCKQIAAVYGLMQAFVRTTEGKDKNVNDNNLAGTRKADSINVNTQEKTHATSSTKAIVLNECDVSAMSVHNIRKYFHLTCNKIAVCLLLHSEHVKETSHTNKTQSEWMAHANKKTCEYRQRMLYWLLDESVSNYNSEHARFTKKNSKGNDKKNSNLLFRQKEGKGVMPELNSFTFFMEELDVHLPHVEKYFGFYARIGKEGKRACKYTSSSPSPSSLLSSSQSSKELCAQKYKMYKSLRKQLSSSNVANINYKNIKQITEDTGNSTMFIGVRSMKVKQTKLRPSTYFTNSLELQDNLHPIVHTLFELEQNPYSFLLLYQNNNNSILPKKRENNNDPGMQQEFTQKSELICNVPAYLKVNIEPSILQECICYFDELKNMIVECELRPKADIAGIKENVTFLKQCSNCDYDNHREQVNSPHYYTCKVFCKEVQVKIWFAVNTFTPTKRYINKTNFNNNCSKKNGNSGGDSSNSAHKRKKSECNKMPEEMQHLLTPNETISAPTQRILQHLLHSYQCKRKWIEQHEESWLGDEYYAETLLLALSNLSMEFNSDNVEKEHCRENVNTESENSNGKFNNKTTYINKCADNSSLSTEETNKHNLDSGVSIKWHEIRISLYNEVNTEERVIVQISQTSSNKNNNIYIISQLLNDEHVKARQEVSQNCTQQNILHDQFDFNECHKLQNILYIKVKLEKVMTEPLTQDDYLLCLYYVQVIQQSMSAARLMLLHAVEDKHNNSDNNINNNNIAIDNQESRQTDCSQLEQSENRNDDDNDGKVSHLIKEQEVNMHHDIDMEKESNKNAMECGQRISNNDIIGNNKSKMAGDSVLQTFINLHIISAKFHLRAPRLSPQGKALGEAMWRCIPSLHRSKVDTNLLYHNYVFTLDDMKLAVSSGMIVDTNSTSGNGATVSMLNSDRTINVCMSDSPEGNVHLWVNDDSRYVIWCKSLFVLPDLTLLIPEFAGHDQGRMHGTVTIIESALSRQTPQQTNESSKMANLEELTKENTSEKDKIDIYANESKCINRCKQTSCKKEKDQTKNVISLELEIKEGGSGMKEEINASIDINRVVLHYIPAHMGDSWVAVLGNYFTSEATNASIIDTDQTTTFESCNDTSAAAAYACLTKEKIPASVLHGEVDKKSLHRELEESDVCKFCLSQGVKTCNISVCVSNVMCVYEPPCNDANVLLLAHLPSLQTQVKRTDDSKNASHTRVLCNMPEPLLLYMSNDGNTAKHAQTISMKYNHKNTHIAHSDKLESNTEKTERKRKNNMMYNTRLLLNYINDSIETMQQKLSDAGWICFASVADTSPNKNKENRANTESRLHHLHKHAINANDACIEVSVDSTLHAEKPLVLNVHDIFVDVHLSPRIITSLSCITSEALLELRNLRYVELPHALVMRSCPAVFYRVAECVARECAPMTYLINSEIFNQHSQCGHSSVIARTTSTNINDDDDTTVNEKSILCNNMNTSMSFHANVNEHIIVDESNSTHTRTSFNRTDDINNSTNSFVNSHVMKSALFRSACSFTKSAIMPQRNLYYTHETKSQLKSERHTVDLLNEQNEEEKRLSAYCKHVNELLHGLSWAEHDKVISVQRTFCKENVENANGQINEEIHTKANWRTGSASSIEHNLSVQPNENEWLFVEQSTQKNLHQEQQKSLQQEEEEQEEEEDWQWEEKEEWEQYELSLWEMLEEEETESPLSSECSASSFDWVDLEKEEAKAEASETLLQNTNHQNNSNNYEKIKHTVYTEYEHSRSSNNSNINNKPNEKVKLSNNETSLTSWQIPFDVHNTSMLRGLSIYYADPSLVLPSERQDLNRSRHLHYHHHQLAPVTFELFLYSCNANVNVYNEDVLHNSYEHKGQLCNNSKEKCKKHNFNFLHNATASLPQDPSLITVICDNTHPKLVLEVCKIRCQLDQFAFGAEEKRWMHVQVQSLVVHDYVDRQDAMPMLCKSVKEESKNTNNKYMEYDSEEFVELSWLTLTPSYLPHLRRDHKSNNNAMSSSTEMNTVFNLKNVQETASEHVKKLNVTNEHVRNETLNGNAEEVMHVQLHPANVIWRGKSLDFVVRLIEECSKQSKEHLHPESNKTERQPLKCNSLSPTDKAKSTREKLNLKSGKSKHATRIGYEGSKPTATSAEALLDQMPPPLYFRLFTLSPTTITLSGTFESNRSIKESIASHKTLNVLRSMPLISWMELDRLHVPIPRITVRNCPAPLLFTEIVANHTYFSFHFLLTVCCCVIKPLATVRDWAAQSSETMLLLVPFTNVNYGATAYAFRSAAQTVVNRLVLLSSNALVKCGVGTSSMSQSLLTQMLNRSLEQQETQQQNINPTVIRYSPMSFRDGLRQGHFFLRNGIEEAQQLADFGSATSHRQLFVHLPAAALRVFLAISQAATSTLVGVHNGRNCVRSLPTLHNTNSKEYITRNYMSELTMPVEHYPRKYFRINNNRSISNRSNNDDDVDGDWVMLENEHLLLEDIL